MLALIDDRGVSGLWIRLRVSCHDTGSQIAMPAASIPDRPFDYYFRRWNDCQRLKGRQMRCATMFILACLCVSTVHADDLPAGIVNTQNPNDVSLSPQESLARITVPDGFHVTLFAGEPALRRPIAFDFDDRGRIWVAENYSHPVWKKDGATDRILIFEDTDHDGQFDSRKVFWDKGRYLTGMAVGHGGVWIGNTPELTFIPDA
ncbi:MAG: hypothetical protein VB858_19900, partial [Planctomycetaceae bacterium]